MTLTPDQIALKPCPFCGGECDPKGWMRNDGTTGPECVECGATAASAEAWNIRAQDEKLRRVGELFGLLEDQIRRIDNPDSRAIRKNAADNVGRYLSAIHAILNGEQPGDEHEA